MSSMEISTFLFGEKMGGAESAITSEMFRRDEGETLSKPYY